ncbi:probable G-protein coupled receptor 139 isoform X2 [Octopus sinensis]|uniref:Probable G-protein coupled receptor 139 isoform X2 n=1 Tax=Octopus sinensis TaxID=2607531 RepID=A0A6P7T987_9MOLL|nr:probable G-protein coupled receptor 139 isoform X2 [Octopus sinensis]
MTNTTTVSVLEATANVTLNCEDDYIHRSILLEYVPESIYVDRYTTPFLYIIGFPGNILSFIVWIQRRMRHSSGYYLAAIALADLFFLALQIVHEAQSAWFLTVLDYPIICGGYPVLFMTCQYLPPLFVLGFTVERYISVCHPFKRERYCTTRRAKIVILALIILSFSLSSMQGYFWHYNSACQSCSPRKWAINTSFWTIWTWIVEFLIFMLVPGLVLIFNILVILEVRRMSKIELHGNEQRTSATTLMLLTVSFYLIFTVLPVTVTTSLYTTFPYGKLGMSEEETRSDPIWKRFFTYVFIKAIVNEIGLTHFVFNFFIYLITGRQFRKELEKLITSSIICTKWNAYRQRDFSTSGESTWASRYSKKDSLGMKQGVNGHTSLLVNCNNTTTTTTTNTETVVPTNPNLTLL